MLSDVRIRSSNRSTKVPASYRAFVYRYGSFSDCIGTITVIIAPDRMHAEQRLKDFCYEQGIDLFFTYIGEDDFQVCGLDSDYTDILL